MNTNHFDSSSIRIGNIEIRYLVDGSRAGHSGLFEMLLPPRTGVQPSPSHEEADEVVFVLKGRMRHAVDGVVRELGPGDSAFTPRGSVHGFSNPYGEPVRTLTVVTPDIGPQYFRDLAAVMDAYGGPDEFAMVESIVRNGLPLAAATARAA